MAKAAPDVTLDKMFDYLVTSDGLYVCSSQPALYSNIAAATLASSTLTTGNGNGDYTKADDTSGRKLTIATQSSLSISASGTATHIVLADTSATTLTYVTTCTSQSLTSGGTVTVPEWKINIADPT